MDLLERESQLGRLRAASMAAAEGNGGRCVLVAGEAGIGKTALVQAFVAGLGPPTRVLQGGCEPLYTPRPLGPWLDMAMHLPPSIEHALRLGPGHGALHVQVHEWLLGLRTPCVLVFEDAHWADVGSLDLIQFLGRRLVGLRLLMVLTYRESALGESHPLRTVLGHLPSAVTDRIALPPLSAASVATLARAAGRDAQALLATTGGNPFCVVEALAVPAGEMPLSVRDAVRAQFMALDAPARALVQWTSLCPGQAPRSMLQRLGVDHPAAAAAALRSGLVAEAAGPAGEPMLAFRHELAREVVYDDAPSMWRREGHAAVHAALIEAGGDDEVARAVHHAEAAGLDAAVATLAPRAAARALAGGDPAEAARLYALALQRAGAATPAQRARWHAARADALLLVNRHREAIESREAALALHGDDARQQGVQLRELARLHWLESGSGGPALQLASRAVDVLAALGPTADLALAYSAVSHLCLVAEDTAGARDWGLRAIELAEGIDAVGALVHALNNVACARLYSHDDPMAWDRLARSLELARQHDLRADAARAYNNLFILGVVHRRFDQALAHARAGVAYCEAHGLNVFNVRIRIRRAYAYLLLGRWDLADADLAEVAERHTPSPMEACTLAFVAALLDVRRGVAGAPERLREADRAMQRHRVELWFVSAAAVQIEAAWLAGAPDLVEAAHALAAPVLPRLQARGDRWRAGELQVWLRRADPSSTPDAFADLPAPYACELGGQWREAAREWQRLGCPYEQALALADGDDAALRAAVKLLDALGAQPAAARVRRLLRGRGARSVPRGPVRRTRSDPLGFTASERAVFDLMCRGWSNAAIAARLNRSERTVEHHAAAVLRKTGTASRVELVARHGVRSRGDAD